MNHKFRSRISVLLTAFILIVIGLTSLAAIKNGEWEGVYVTSGVLAFVLITFMGIRYEITSDKLLIKLFWIPYFRVKLEDIVSIERSYNPLSSPAASLKRLSCEIKGNRLFPYMLISPVDEAEFLELIQRRNPNVKINVDDPEGAWRVWDWDI